MTRVVWLNLFEKVSKNRFRLSDIIGLVCGHPSRSISSYLRISNCSLLVRRTKLKKRAARSLQRFGVFISPHAIIPLTTRFPHPTAIVIGEGVVLEDNITIYQGVTIGAARIGDWKLGNYPSIGSGTVLFAGAVILGNISIGRNCIVGANSVVLNDIPDNSVCVGAPAKVVKSKSSL